MKATKTFDRRILDRLIQEPEQKPPLSGRGEKKCPLGGGIVFQPVIAGKKAFE